MGRQKKHTPDQLKQKRREYSKKSYLKHKNKVDEKARARYQNKRDGLSA